MKVSFPYMGCVTGFKKLFELLGHEVIMPEKPTQRTIDLGVLNSPEFICYPFKIMMGTYIEACEKGAELIVSSGGSGPCRAGIYGDVHKKILHELGYDVEIVIFDSLFENFGAFMNQVFKIKNKTPTLKVMKYAYLVFKMINQMDGIEKELKHLRAYEVNKGDFDKCFDKIKELYDKTYTLKQMKKTYAKALEMLHAVPVNIPPENKRVRIGIVGEIYVIMESSTNMDIEKRLNALGVEVENIQYISDWVKHHIIPRRFSKEESWKMFNKGYQYKSCNCGGHDMENTGAIVHFSQKGYDGVVHLMPFGCLPELITRSIIPQITEDYGIPVLSMSMDEQQGEANIQTRLEAFIDLCKNRSNKQQISPAEAANSKELKKEFAGIM